MATHLAAINLGVEKSKLEKNQLAQEMIVYNNNLELEIS